GGGRVAGGAAARLVVVTAGATADDPDPAAAAVWGLVRGAQAENPGRIVLVDVDEAVASRAARPAAAGPGETQPSLRAGGVRGLRLARLARPDRAGADIDPGRTVLITGGTGALGAHLARQLVDSYGVRHLVLAGRRGDAAEGADALRADLA